MQRSESGTSARSWEPCVTALLELGADASVTDKMGMCAVHSGADCDDKSVMAALLATDKGKAAIDMADEVCGPPRTLPAPELGARAARLGRWRTR